MSSSHSAKNFLKSYSLLTIRQIEGSNTLGKGMLFPDFGLPGLSGDGEGCLY